jgi:hypothetical protein
MTAIVDFGPDPRISENRPFWAILRGPEMTPKIGSNDDFIDPINSCSSDIKYFYTLWYIIEII